MSFLHCKDCKENHKCSWTLIHLDTKRALLRLSKTYLQIVFPNTYVHISKTIHFWPNTKMYFDDSTICLHFRSCLFTKSPFLTEYITFLLLQCHFSNNCLASTRRLWYHPIGQVTNLKAKYGGSKILCGKWTCRRRLFQPRRPCYG